MRESGWLIERNIGGVPMWWNGDGFLSDSLAAVRFARKQDAERVREVFRNEFPVLSFATEHVWDDLKPTLGEQPPETP